MLKFVQYAVLLGTAAALQAGEGMTQKLGQWGVNAPIVHPHEEPLPPPSGLTYLWHLLSFAFILKFCAIGSNVIMQLAPYRDVARMRKRGCTGEKDGLPFCMIMICGMEWCFYGIFAWYITGNHGFLIVVYANVCGVLLGSFYTFNFHMNCNSEQRAKNLRRYYSGAIFVALFQLGMICTLRPETALLCSGAVAASLSVLVTASPLIDLKTVLKTRSTVIWPEDLIFASFLSSILWAACGMMLRDLWILCPNFFALAIGGGQITLILRFRMEESMMAERKALVGESEGSSLAPASYQAVASEQQVLLAAKANKIDAEHAKANYPSLCKGEPGAEPEGEDPEAGFNDMCDGTTGGTCGDGTGGTF